MWSKLEKKPWPDLGFKVANFGGLRFSRGGGSFGFKKANKNRLASKSLVAPFLVKITCEFSLWVNLIFKWVSHMPINQSMKPNT